MIQKQICGTINGAEVTLFTLDNGVGLSAEIMNYGGIIKRLTFQGTDVGLGRNTPEEYHQGSGCFGALIGRNSNRLENAEFMLNGKKYTLCKNDGRNNLHGGDENSFRNKIWTAEMNDAAEPQLKLTLTSPDGEEGFPGTAEVTVIYTLTMDNAVRIAYSGVCDADTLMNLTNHTYFNLNGHGSGVIDTQTVQLDADFYTPNTNECMPNGEIRSVAGTAFDLRKEKAFAEVFASQEDQIRMFDGFDHNFCLRGSGYRTVGCMRGDQSGIVMEIETDCPGVQIYTGNGIAESDICKDGVSYRKHQGVCFETQAFPNAMAYSHFPSIVLKKGEVYQTTTAYQFR